jgi:site-specific recombinase XerD
LTDNLPVPAEAKLVVRQDEHLSAAAAAFVRNSTAEATRKAYDYDWGAFADWCAERGTAPLSATPATVAAFLATQAEQGVKGSTIARRVVAIGYAYRLVGKEPTTNSEAVKATLRGIRRAIGTARDQKAPLTADRLVDVLRTIPDTLTGKRDRALLALGFAGALRQSELVSLTIADLTETPDGIRVLIRHSKGDQEGQGQEIAIPHGNRLRPVQALRAWLDAASITDGPIFRSIAKGGRVQPVADRSVLNIIKMHAERAGFDPAEFSGHSLRSGFLTSGAEHGASVFKLMEVSRHKSADTLRGYIRRADQFRDHAGAGFL